jgi:glutamyl-Q tRNA(Asp) synthetase
LSTKSLPIVIRDRIQGALHQDLEREVGDFVLRRADGIYAYQIAVAVDDAYQGITHVVRGADLMTSTPRQTYLHRLLASPVPAYAHVPLAVDCSGRKLSKSDAASPIDPANSIPSLLPAWSFLGQLPFADRPAGLTELWTRARATWDTNRIPRKAVRSLPPG